LRITEVEVSGRLELACGGCGGRLTLANRVVGAGPRSSL
jgi:hypothetical protein